MTNYIYLKLYICFITCSLFFGIPEGILAQGNPDTSINVSLHPELNYIQFYNPSSLAKIVAKWSSPTPDAITIAHLGDSHVQSDVFPGELRKNLQAIKGNGGRGMIFPYAIAKTYSGNDYKSLYSGSWKCARSIEYIPRLPLGASGITCQTFDSNASFTIQFKTPLSEKNKTLKIFCKKSYSSYDFIVKTREKEVLVVVDNYVCPDQPYVAIELPVIGDTITVQLTKQNPHEREFELYGMSLEAGANEGLVLHCLGIGGAQYRSILAQTLFQDQLPFLNPDLVIVDFGTNDYLYTDEIPENMESEIKKVIKKVRLSAPNADLLLTTPQDMNRKGLNIESGEAFSDLIRKIAKEENCAFYDWFWISGGPRTMTTWQQKGLSYDMIHLTPNGYKLKGQLLSDALLKTISILQNSPNKDSLIFPLDSLKKAAKAGDTIQPKIPKPVYNSFGYRTVVHTIRAGETLGGIARKYHTTVSAICCTFTVSPVVKGLSKNILLITLLVLVNLAIFLFCKLLTDEGNYLWYNTTSERKFLVSIACIDLMRIKYFTYANSINICLLGIYFAYYFKKRMGFILVIIGLVVFLGGNKLFEENIYEDYYIIFQNQKVSEDFLLEPVKSGGKGMGKYLLNDVNNPRSPLRKQAIIGMGLIKYDPAAEVLNTILHDIKEPSDIRGEAYLALVKIDSEKSASYARIFMGSAHPVDDHAVMKYIKAADKR